MEIQTSEQLTKKKCEPCEGGLDACPLPEAQQQLAKLKGWELTHEGKRIRKNWQVKNFVAAIEFFKQVCDVAESEAHHPDLHVENYRDVWIEIWTHAIGGLSENDFILAAKIDELDVETG